MTSEITCPHDATECQRHEALKALHFIHFVQFDEYKMRKAVAKTVCIKDNTREGGLYAVI